MAYVKSDQTSKMILKVETGTTASGALKCAERSFGNVNPELGTDDLGALATAMSALQSYPLNAIVRQDTCVITAE